MSNVHVPAGAVVDKSPVPLELTAVALLVVDLYLALAIATRDGKRGPELVGYTIGVVFVLLLVLGIARLFGKGKTRRGRAVIAVWTLAVVLFSNVANLGETRAPEPATRTESRARTS
jgi:hypothetical protein